MFPSGFALSPRYYLHHFLGVSRVLGIFCHLHNHCLATAAVGAPQHPVTLISACSNTEQPCNIVDLSMCPSAHVGEGRCTTKVLTSPRSSWTTGLGRSAHVGNAPTAGIPSVHMRVADSLSYQCMLDFNIVPFTVVVLFRLTTTLAFVSTRSSTISVLLTC